MNMVDFFWNLWPTFKKILLFCPARQVSENQTIQNICFGSFGDFVVIFSHLYLFLLLGKNLKVY